MEQKDDLIEKIIQQLSKLMPKPKIMIEEIKEDYSLGYSLSQDSNFKTKELVPLPPHF